MAYRYSVANISRRRVDGILTGAVITIKCENTAGGESELTWFVEKEAFPVWPPSRKDARGYIKTYLTSKIPGSTITRAAQMKQKTAIISDDPESWSEQAKELDIS